MKPHKQIDVFTHIHNTALLLLFTLDPVSLVYLKSLLWDWCGRSFLMRMFTKAAENALEPSTDFI